MRTRLEAFVTGDNPGAIVLEIADLALPECAPVPVCALGASYVAADDQ